MTSLLRVLFHSIILWLERNFLVNFVKTVGEHTQAIEPMRPLTRESRGEVSVFSKHSNQNVQH